MLETLNTIQEKIEKLENVFREFFIRKGFEPEVRDDKICVSKDGNDIGCAFHNAKNGRVLIQAGSDFSEDLEHEIVKSGFDTELSDAGFWVNLG